MISLRSAMPGSKSGVRAVLEAWVESVLAGATGLGVVPDMAIPDDLGDWLRRGWIRTVAFESGEATWSRAAAFALADAVDWNEVGRLVWEREPSLRRALVQGAERG